MDSTAHTGGNIADGDVAHSVETTQRCHLQLNAWGGGVAGVAIVNGVLDRRPDAQQRRSVGQRQRLVIDAVGVAVDWCTGRQQIEPTAVQIANRRTPRFRRDPEVEITAGGEVVVGALPPIQVAPLQRMSQRKVVQVVLSRRDANGASAVERILVRRGGPEQQFVLFAGDGHDLERVAGVIAQQGKG